MFIYSSVNLIQFSFLTDYIFMTIIIIIDLFKLEKTRILFKHIEWIYSLVYELYVGMCPAVESISVQFVSNPWLATGT